MFGSLLLRLPVSYDHSKVGVLRHDLHISRLPRNHKFEVPAFVIGPVHKVAFKALGRTRALEFDDGHRLVDAHLYMAFLQTLQHGSHRSVDFFHVGCMKHLPAEV